MFDPADFKHSHQIISIDEFKLEVEDLKSWAKKGTTIRKGFKTKSD